METTQSFGERRVRVDFNPSQRDEVVNIKEQTAWLIDLLEGLKEKDGHDPRLIALAQTTYEEAAMWAVKAATA